MVSGWRLHRGECEQLEEVALEHVAQDAGVFVVRGTVAYIEVFENGDLDVVDVVAIPQRLEDGVAEAEDDQVLDGVFAEVVVDAEQLMLVCAGVYRLVEEAS